MATSLIEIKSRLYDNCPTCPVAKNIGENALMAIKTKSEDNPDPQPPTAHLTATVLCSYNARLRTLISKTQMFTEQKKIVDAAVSPVDNCPGVQDAPLDH